jgi:CHAD domain-containing protein
VTVAGRPETPPEGDAERPADSPRRDDRREVELKYTVFDSAAARELMSGPTVAGFEAGEWRTRFVVDRYLDTPSAALSGAGYGARVRRVDGERGHVLTVKSIARRRSRGRSPRGRNSSAVHDRVELEGPATSSLDPRRWPESEARALVQATIGGERLRTLFVLDQRREERELLREGEAIATVSLDAGTVRRLGRPIGAINALEIELGVRVAEPGDRADRDGLLDAVAAALEGSDAVAPESRSKEALALAMISHGVGAGAVMRPPRKAGLTADDTLSESGRKVLRMHLLRMIAAEPSVRAANDVEAVKKMRVATRRMRAAWRVFDGAYRPRHERRYVSELREAARTLGALRDVDVQIERLDGHAAGLAPGAAAELEPLIGEWRDRRSDAQRKLLDLLGSAAYDRFVADYLAFVETPGSGDLAGPPVQLRHVVGGRIWRAYERLRAHDAVVSWADVPALHALRIDAKRLRYTLEFVREILPAATDPLIAELVTLQDTLGTLNDAQIAADTTRSWLIDSAATLTRPQQLAAGAYLREAEAEVAGLRRSFRAPWRRVSGVTFRRRLAAVAGSV